MKVNEDQPKKVVSRKIIFQHEFLSLELVEFSTPNGSAFGCRVFSDVQSVITDLYDNEAEAIEQGEKTPVQI